MGGMRLDPLFHWSLSSRRHAIEAGGLRPWAPAVTSVWKPDTDEHVHVAWPWVCLGTDPALAWQLSGGMGWDGLEDDTWDLWLVTLADGDEVHVMPEFGSSIKEVRVHTPIPGSRCWYVGTREPVAARELGPAVRVAS